MPTIGLDCELILDGTGYFVKPGSYSMHQPRTRKATLRADGNLSYVDLGAGKRRWHMTLLCLNDLLCADGSATGYNGQQYRDALRASYLNSRGTTIQYLDPLNSSPIPVHFDDYSEHVPNLRIQQVALASGLPAGLSYEVTIELLEA